MHCLVANQLLLLLLLPPPTFIQSFTYSLQGFELATPSSELTEGDKGRAGYNACTHVSVTSTHILLLLPPIVV
jgi:hypothetical protein